MRKSIRLILAGTIQGMFFKKTIKDIADKNNVKGFLRNADTGKAEIFLEGDVENVDAVINLCKTNLKHAAIKNIEEKEERFQDFKDFQILR